MLPSHPHRSRLVPTSQPQLSRSAPDDELCVICPRQFVTRMMLSPEAGESSADGQEATARLRHVRAPDSWSLTLCRRGAPRGGCWFPFVSLSGASTPCSYEYESSYIRCLRLSRRLVALSTSVTREIVTNNLTTPSSRGASVSSTRRLDMWR